MPNERFVVFCPRIAFFGFCIAIEGGYFVVFCPRIASFGFRFSAELEIVWDFVVYRMRHSAMTIVRGVDAQE